MGWKEKSHPSPHICHFPRHPPGIQMRLSFAYRLFVMSFVDIVLYTVRHWTVVMFGLLEQNKCQPQQTSVSRNGRWFADAGKIVSVKLRWAEHLKNKHTHTQSSDNPEDNKNFKTAAEILLQIQLFPFFENVLLFYKRFGLFSLFLLFYISSAFSV